MNTTELLMDLPDCVLVLDGSGQVRWGNTVAERLFGRSLRDSIGFSALELVHPDDLALVLRSLESVQRKEVGTLIEVRARTPSGWCLLEVRGTPIDLSNEETAILFCMRDLTERRRFEVAGNRDAAFRTVVQNSPDMTLLLSRSGTVDSVSGALSRILGHDPELIEGRQLVDFITDEDRLNFLNSVQAASKGATASNPQRVRIRFPRRGTQESVPFELCLVNLLDDPTVHGFVVSARDITTQVIAESELHQSEQRFRRVFDQGPVGIILTDFNQKITEANDAFCRLVDRPSRDVVGSTLSSFVHSGDREKIQTAVSQLVALPALQQETEIRIDSNQQDAIVAAVTASVIQDENGVSVHFLCIVQDVTKRKMLERERVSHAHTAAMLLATLTSRETQILELMEESASASQLGNRLSLSTRTVESHLASAYRKLGVHSRSAAIVEFARLSKAAGGAQPEDGS